METSKTAKLIFFFTDIVARLIFAVSIVSLLLLPFGDLNQIYYTYKGYEPLWLGYLVDISSSLLGILFAYFYLSRNGLFVAAIAIISIAGAAILSQSILVTLVYLLFHMIMALPWWIALKQQSVA